MQVDRFVLQTKHDPMHCFDNLKQHDVDLQKMEIGTYKGVTYIECNLASPMHISELEKVIDRDIFDPWPSEAYVLTDRSEWPPMQHIKKHYPARYDEIDAKVFAERKARAQQEEARKQQPQVAGQDAGLQQGAGQDAGLQQGAGQDAGLQQGAGQDARLQQGAGQDAGQDAGLQQVVGLQQQLLAAQATIATQQATINGQQATIITGHLATIAAQQAIIAAKEETNTKVAAAKDEANAALIAAAKDAALVELIRKYLA